MAISKGCWLFLFCSIFSFLTLVYGNVPVLLWESNKSNKETTFPALSRVSSDVFSQYLLKKVQGQEPLPLVVLFQEPSLSTEDFSGQDSQQQGYFPKLQNITASAAGVEFITSVESPIEAIKQLEKYGYKIQIYDEVSLPTKDGVLLIFKLEDANIDEDRPELLRRHDIKIISLYSDLLALYSHVIAIFTGVQSSWVEPEEVTRLKRDIRATNSNKINWKAGDSNQQVLFYSSSLPEFFDGTNNIDLSAYYPPMNVTKSFSGVTLSLTAKFYKGNLSISLKFVFSSGGGYWTLDYVSVTSGDGSSSSTVFLTPLDDIFAPINMSYHSSLSTVFISNSTDKAKLTFSDLQVEPFFAENASSINAFNDAVDSITFFTIPIWSGIFTITILSMIFIWGLTMLMDVRTMDQFDDPKGKTITVSASE